MIQRLEGGDGFVWTSRREGRGSGGHCGEASYCVAEVGLNGIMGGRGEEACVHKVKKG